MNDITSQLHTHSTIMQEKNVPSTKQTEEKHTNKQISMPSECFFCHRRVRNYSYLVETVYELDWSTFEFTDEIQDVISRGIICVRCRDYNIHAKVLILREEIEVVDETDVSDETKSEVKEEKKDSNGEAPPDFEIDDEGQITLF